MSRERNRDTGRFVQTLTLDAVLRAMREASDPVVTAKELSERLDCSSEAVRQKLVQLHDQGLIERRKVGAGAVIWWIDDDAAEPSGINVDDPFWSLKSAAGEPVAEDEIDDILYGGDE
ncbi:HTH domain-containing protein [Haladaptatus pallidirubidus]|nr:HTH domain-containing protein [Haladaptatus pallidirubidus]